MSNRLEAAKVILCLKISAIFFIYFSDDSAGQDKKLAVKIFAVFSAYNENILPLKHEKASKSLAYSTLFEVHWF
ncbi:MAG TPA: hypothetical protein VK400_10690 [Pyrinomonadaceae bacterium]|nr:hypothetical protein [Pyrinomonadaceae bacterium]